MSDSGAYVDRHINLQGEYDFTKHTANNKLFNIDKIMELGNA